MWVGTGVLYSAGGRKQPAAADEALLAVVRRDHPGVVAVLLDGEWVRK
jgi:hypothetical protein